MQHRLLFATAIVALMLASCATTVGFDISGEYAVTGTITESTNGGYSVGDTFDEVFVVSESGGTVTIHIGLETWEGTRSGNTVEVTYSNTNNESSFTLTWLSNTTFEGSGRTDDLVGGTYWEYDLTGTATSP